MTNEAARAVRAARKPMREQRDAWKLAAVGVFALSLAGNIVLYGAQFRADKLHRAEVAQLQSELLHVEAVRDDALTELGALALSTARDVQEREKQAKAYEATGAYQYIGEFIITAYCPCAKCCGEYADGLTATGIPAGPGVVAVDPEIVPIGSTIVIDGQKYLAADTGGAIKGNRIDICMADHSTATAFGKKALKVWIENDV